MKRDDSLAEFVRQLDYESQPYGAAFFDWMQRLPLHRSLLEPLLRSTAKLEDESTPQGVVLGALQLVKRDLAELQEQYSQLLQEQQQLVQQLQRLGAILEEQNK